MSKTTMVQLRDIGSWSGGNTPSKANAAYWTNGTVPWVSPKDMKVEEIVSSEDLITELALTEKRVSIVPEGSVLFVTRSGILSHTFPVAVTKLPVTINQDLKALTPREGISPKYVAHALRGASQRILKECAKHGTTVASIETSRLLDFQIPVFGIQEQLETVAEIEKQFSRLDAAVANLKRVKANLKRLTDSIYGEAFSNAPNFTLGDLIDEGPQNGLYLPKEMYGEGVPILRIDDYQTAWIRPFTDLRRVKATPAQISTWALQENDLVINRVNSMTHLGKCALVPSWLAGAVFESNMMRMRFFTAALPKYIEHYLASRLGKTRLTENAKWAVNQASINQKDIRATPIFLPDLAVQHQVVAEIDCRLSIVKEAEIAVDTNLKRAQTLRQAILAKSFGQ